MKKFIIFMCIIVGCAGHVEEQSDYYDALDQIEECEESSAMFNSISEEFTKACEYKIIDTSLVVGITEPIIYTQSQMDIAIAKRINAESMYECCEMQRENLIREWLGVEAGGYNGI